MTIPRCIIEHTLRVGGVGWIGGHISDDTPRLCEVDDILQSKCDGPLLSSPSQTDDLKIATLFQ